MDTDQAGDRARPVAEQRDDLLEIARGMNVDRLHALARSGAQGWAGADCRSSQPPNLMSAAAVPPFGKSQRRIMAFPPAAYCREHSVASGRPASSIQ